MAKIQTLLIVHSIWIARKKKGKNKLFPSLIWDKKKDEIPQNWIGKRTLQVFIDDLVQEQ
jgi:hypothetical protein